MRILAIETSCDDTGIAILEANKNGSFKVLSNIVSSQIEIHKKYGGVYPAMAKREHQRNLVSVLTRSLKQAKLLKIHSVIRRSALSHDRANSILEREPELRKKLIPFLKKYEKPDVDLIAVTQGPGLEPCLWVGVNFAKALSYFWNIPIVPVNHIEAHMLVNFLIPKQNSSEQKREQKRCNFCATAQKLQRDKKLFPAVCLVVSGGHTQLILMRGIGKYKILGETRDDAAGECFDKCAKILGLPYPGGPAIAASAAKSETINPNFKNYTLNAKPYTLKLPRPMINTKDYDFSFSGLKTAVLYAWQKMQKVNGDRLFASRQKADQLKIAFAKEVQQAIIDVLLKKTMKATKDFKAKSIILGGGVSANTELRKQFKKRITTDISGFLPRGKKPDQIKLFVPSAELSTDNALMTAVTAYFHRNKKLVKSDLAKLKAEANLRIN